jgi:SepF-like predicted cell division protein (DUF552 family)
MSKPKFIVILSSDMKLASQDGKTVLEFDDAIGLEVRMLGADGRHHLVVGIDGMQDGNVLMLDTSVLDSGDKRFSRILTTIPTE